MREEEHFTYEDYAAWPEDEPRNPVKNQLRGKPCKPYVSPVDVMPKVSPGQDFKRTDSVVQPDVLVGVPPGS